MACFGCGEPRSYDRVVIERATGETLGSVCSDCEAALVGAPAAQQIRSMATCLVCGADSELLLPRWDSLVEDDVGGVELEYTVSLTTPALCTTCVSARRTAGRVGDVRSTELDDW